MGKFGLVIRKNFIRIWLFRFSFALTTNGHLSFGPKKVKWGS